MTKTTHPALEALKVAKATTTDRGFRAHLERQAIPALEALLAERDERDELRAALAEFASDYHEIEPDTFDKNGKRCRVGVAGIHLDWARRAVALTKTRTEGEGAQDSDAEPTRRTQR